jgi:hypothetical protein
MNSIRRKNVLLALVLLALFATVWYWQAPGSRLTAGETENYLGRMQAGLPMEEVEKREFIERLRRWSAEDDGRPVHMLNLIRFHDDRPQVPGHPEFDGTSEEANAHYEQVILPLLAARGIYPVFASSPQGVETDQGRMTNLLGYEPELEGWDRVMLVRYPNRRAFLDMASEQSYMSAVPFKLAAIDLGFVPLDKIYQLPDPRWIVALASLALLLGMAIRNNRKISDRRAA